VTTARRLDRKTKRAVTLAVIALLAGPLLFLWSGLSSLGADRSIVASSNPDDQVVFVGGHTMLLEPGTLGRRIADWLNIETTDTRAFEIGDQTFAPNSVKLTPTGWSQLARFAQMMKGHPSLRAHLLVSEQIANASIRQLEEMRATRLRDEIIAQGVPQSRVSALDDAAAAVPLARAHLPKDGNSHLLVLLSKK